MRVIIWWCEAVPCLWVDLKERYALNGGWNIYFKLEDDILYYRPCIKTRFYHKIIKITKSPELEGHFTKIYNEVLNMANYEDEEIDIHQAYSIIQQGRKEGKERIKKLKKELPFGGF